MAPVTMVSVYCLLGAALLKDVSASGRKLKLNAGQMLGTRVAGMHQPDFPDYAVSSNYGVALGEQGKLFENEVVNDISEEDLMNTLEQVTTLGVNDSTGPVHGRSWTNPDATDITVTWLQDEFRQMGFEESRICLQKFTEQSQPLANVVAFVDVPGATGSVTVGAHYDSRPFTGEAPGANDNGSGLSALLEIAKVFKDNLGSRKLHKPVYFVAFAGEEAGLFGSKHFAVALKNPSDTSLPPSCRSEAPPAASIFLQKSQKDDVHFGQHEALILDEVGWKSTNLDQETVNLESYDSELVKSILDHLAQSNVDHNGPHGLRIIHSNHPFGSDHMSWLEQGMPSVLSINGDDDAYPNYHKSSDSLASVNSDMLEKVTKMNAGALVRMAGLEDVNDSMIETMKHVSKHF